MPGKAPAHKDRTELQEHLKAKGFRRFLRSTGDALVPPEDIPPLSESDKANIAAVQQKFSDAMKEANIRQPLPQGSTARGTALRGDTIDIDLVARGEADIGEVIRAAIESGFEFNRVFKLTMVESGATVAVFVDSDHPRHPVEVVFFNSDEERNAHVERVAQLGDVYKANPECAEASRMLKLWNRTLTEFRPRFALPSIALETMATKREHRGHDAHTIFRDVMQAIASEDAVRELPPSMNGPKANYTWDLAQIAAEETLKLLDSANSETPKKNHIRVSSKKSKFLYVDLVKDLLNQGESYVDVSGLAGAIADVVEIAEILKAQGIVTITQIETSRSLEGRRSLDRLRVRAIKTADFQKIFDEQQATREARNAEKKNK